MNASETMRFLSLPDNEEEKSFSKCSVNEL
jgi:hypothetical protein